MATIKIENSERAQSNAGWRRSGEQNWWLKKDGGGFVEIPRVRGDRNFEATLDLEPGTYVLGVGKRGPDCRRETIVVSG